jgi:hypothetical protein
MTYVYDIDVDTTVGHEVELLRALARQEPKRPPWGGPQAGERCRCEDSEVRLAEPERVGRRCCFDDLGAGPPHAPPADVGADFEDIHRHLEVFLQGMPKGLWSRIQYEGILEQCVGIPPLWRAMVRRVAVVGVVMTRWLPPG